MNTTMKTSRIRLREPDGTSASVELSGEFDVHDLEPLREALSGRPSPGGPGRSAERRSTGGLLRGPVRSGLSRPEVRPRVGDTLRPLRGHLALQDPPWQVQASFEAFGF